MLGRFCVLRREADTPDMIDSVTEIQGFRRCVDVAFVLLRRNAAYVGCLVIDVSGQPIGPVFKSKEFDEI